MKTNVGVQDLSLSLSLPLSLSPSPWLLAGNARNESAVWVACKQRISWLVACGQRIGWLERVSCLGCLQATNQVVGCLQAASRLVGCLQGTNQLAGCLQGTSQLAECCKPWWCSNIHTRRNACGSNEMSSVGVQIHSAQDMKMSSVIRRL